MPFFLKNRQPGLVEMMDMEDCDLGKLEKTYEHFYKINRLLSKWNSIYRRYLRPVMQGQNRTYTLLDIGFGGGDIPIALAKWANKDGIKLEITAIETDQRAIQFVNPRPAPANVSFRYKDSSELIDEKVSFDFVISNHVLHHLDDEALHSVLNEARTLSTKGVVFNDIERSDIGYMLFIIFSRLFFRRSFVTIDGPISIKRSFTKKELEQIKPKGWTVKRMLPFRLLLMYWPHEG